MRARAVTTAIVAAFSSLAAGTIPATQAADTLAAQPSPPAHAEVWIGGSRAWPDLISPQGPDQWRFLQANVDGFYINNFAMRHKDASEEPQKRQDLEAIRALIAHKDVFYETDRIHDSDAFDKVSLRLFQEAKLRWVGTTINYGNDTARTKTLTDNGRLPLYYMFGPWQGGGDIARPENAALRTSILDASGGGAVDGPVTMWRKNAGSMNQMCYSTIRWCHANGKKFLYLLAPSESGKDFLAESRKLAHGMEDNDANPDIWAVSFYGPKEFRDRLETLPESQKDGQPAETFCGAAYWLLHHLRDPDHDARLSIIPQKGVVVKSDAVSVRTKTGRTEVTLALANRSTWLDLAPVVRAHIAEGTLPADWHLHWFRGSEDVTSAVEGSGLVFTRDCRLEPGSSEALRLEIDRGGAAGASGKVRLKIELLPHPSETTPEQAIIVELTAP